MAILFFLLLCGRLGAYAPASTLKSEPICSTARLPAIVKWLYPVRRLTGFKFLPGLWLFPMFIICISPIIPYEQRYAAPFFLYIAPVAAMYVLQYVVAIRKQLEVRTASIEHVPKPRTGLAIEEFDLAPT